MNDPSVSLAPLVDQALRSLRGNASERTPPSPPAAAQIQAELASDPQAKPEPRTQAKPAPGTPAKRAPGTPAKPAPETPAKAAPRTQAKPDQAQLKRDAPQINLDVRQTHVSRDAVSSVKLRQLPGGPSVSVDSALEALRTVSVSAQTRLADPEDFPELPTERDLSDLGPYVEHVMREAQAAAAAYRKEADRETTARAAKLLGAATASAERIRDDADAYGERTLAQADALLADRVHRIAELTGRLSQMAQLAGDEFAGDQTMRDQMMQFIADLTAAAEEAVTDAFPNTTSSAHTPHSDDAQPQRNARP
jgi:hypothetical protein